jgi:hypothetical protein
MSHLTIEIWHHHKPKNEHKLNLASEKHLTPKVHLITGILGHWVWEINSKLADRDSPEKWTVIIPDLYQLLLGGAITILKNMSSSMGRKIPYIIIYEMENKSHVPNQPD